MLAEIKEDSLVKNRYKILKKIGEGGMGFVYLVEDFRDEEYRFKALKVISPDRLIEPAAIQYFKKEFTLLSSFHHKNLAKVFDFGFDDDRKQYFFTMEYVDGENIYDYTQNSSEAELCELLVQICQALEYIHTKGFIHFDIKPANLLIKAKEAKENGSGTKPHVKLMDFGLAGEYITASGTHIKGTPHYIAPEIIQDNMVDKRADLYSLGILLYQIKTRKLPFDRHSTSKLLRQHLEKPILFPTEISPEWQQIIGKLTAKNPDDRFSNANQIITAINKLFDKNYSIGSDLATNIFSKSNIIGRKQELEILLNALSQLHQPLTSSKVILISGEHGMGKSRLLKELKVNCQINKIEFITQNCDYEMQSFNKPVVSLLDHLLINANTTIVHRHKPALSKFLPELFHDNQTCDGGVNLQSEEDLIILSDSITNFIDDITENNPLVIAVENLHLASEETRKIFSYIARNSGNKLLLCMTFNPNKLDNEFYKSLFLGKDADHKIEKIDLKGLSKSQISAVLNSIFGTGDIPEGFIERLIRETGGNPLFIEKIIENLIEEKFIYFDKTQWIINPKWEIVKFPSSITEALTREFETLPPDEKDILLNLSFFNEPIPLNMLEKVYERDNQDLDISLDRLSYKQFVTKSANGQITFYFSYPILREILYERVNPGKMSETHLQIAELYEQNSDFTNKWGEIAYHFLKGGNIRKAYEYAWEAANNCFSLLETQQIIGILEKIYPQMPDETDKFKITFKLGQLYENISKNDEAIEKYKQAEKSIPPEENRLKLYDRLGTLYRLKGKYDLSSHYLEKALESAEEALDKAYIFTKICTDYQRKGEMDEAQKYLEKTQSIIETAETELTDATQNSALLDIYKELAIFYQKKSDYANSLDYLQKALIIAKNLNKTQATVSIKNLIALVYQNLGKYEEALTNLEKTLNLSKQSGDLLNVGNCYNNISIIHQKLQDFEKSLKYSEQALETYRKIGLERMISSSLTNMANALLSLDRYDEALEYYQKCLKMPSVKKEKRVIAILKNNIGIIYKTQGYIKKSLKSFLQSYKIWEKVQNEYHILLTSLNIIELYSSFNQFEKAEKYLQNAREIVERKKLEIWNEQLYKILFEFHISKKEYEKAQEDLDSYETIFDRDNPSEYGNFLIQKLFLALSTSDIIHAKEIASELQTLIKQHNLSYIAQKSYFPLAKMYLLTKNYRRAIHNFKKAENSTKSLRQKWRIQYYLSTAYEALGVYEEAKIKAENAKELFDSFMEKIGDETLRKSYLQYEPQKSFYDEYERIMKSDENMAATESVESRDSQYRFLLQLNRLISSQLNLGDLLDTIVDAAIDFTDAERGFLLLKNSNDNLECSVAKNKKGEDISSASYTMSSSIVSKVMENGEPELVSDTSRNEFTRNQASIIELNLKSIICVPLKSNIKMEDQENQAFGCIYVDSKSYQKHFDATDADFLNILANQAAISIQNSEMYEKIQRQQKKLKQQYEITKSLGKVLDIEELLIEIMDTVIASTGADRGFLMLYEEKSEALDFKLARNNREETLPEEEMRISFSIANAAIKNKEPIRITMDDSDVFAKAESIVTLNLTSILCAPMIVEGNLLGVVYVDTKKIDNMFDQEAENFLYTLCGGLGIIIHNAQLYTELKKAHKQLMKLDEMKSKFINITSHELRTPLTAIQGYVFYLKKDLTDDERYAKLLEILEQNMLRLSSTVNDVINISKLTSNEMKFKLSEIDIKETVEEVIHRNEPIFDKRNQAFHSEIQDNIGSIEGDKIHLQQAITNILNNAIKYTPDGGEISVSVFRDRKNLYIRIKDTGIGIPEDELNNIFMKFYEVQDISHHSSGTYQFKSGGLGLGLSIAKEIVEGHGGYIDVKSQVEKGSSFTIILPYRDKNKNEQKR